MSIIEIYKEIRMKRALVASIIMILIVSKTSSVFAAVDLCVTYAELGKPEEVIQECSKQINGKVNVEHIERSYMNRAIAYQLTNRLDEAIADFNKVIELDPKYDKAYNDRGNTYLLKNLPDRAIADFDKAITLNPKNAHAYFNRG